MQRVLITGAGGYIGRHVVEAAARIEKVNSVAVDLNPIHVPEGVKICTADILKEASSETLYQRLGSPDFIIHLAWQDGFNHNAISHLNNLSRHYDFLCNMIDSGCSSVAVMGSMHEIGYHVGQIDADTPCNPMSLYGIAKNALRQAITMYSTGKNVSLKWLRAFYVTGDDEHNRSVFAKILEQAKAGKTSFPFTDGKNKYDFLDVDELAQQVVLASIQNDVSGIINVCSGVPVSLKDKVEQFIAKNNLNIKPEFGAFPARQYDSPEIYGNAEVIKQILSKADVK